MLVECSSCVRGYKELLLEEIALEGLDGITLETLWARLSVNREWVVKPIDGTVKEFIWKHLLNLENIQWYVLVNPRKSVPIFSSIKEFLNYDETDVEEKSYKYNEIKNINDVGSCADYDTRKNISEKVLELTLSQAIEEWDNKLVIVASQKVRSYILFSGNHIACDDIDVTTYCILERIARGRYCGELSISLNFIRNGANPTFYFWNKLRKKKFITCQSVTLKRCSHATLFFLRRFHQSLGKHTTTCLVEILGFIENSETKYRLLTELKDLYPRIGKLLQKQVYRDYLVVEKVRYSTLYPNSTQSESVTKHSKERLVTIVKIAEKVEIRKTEMKEDESDDEDEDFNGILEENRFINKPLLTQCYLVVDAAGTDGISQTEVSQKLGITKLLSRMLLKLLVKINLVVCAAPEYANKRFFNYYSKNYSYVKDSKVKEQMDKFFNDNLWNNSQTTVQDFTPDLRDKKRKKKKSHQPSTEETYTKKIKLSEDVEKPNQMEVNENDNGTGEGEEKKELGIDLKNISIYMMRRLNIILENIYKTQVELLTNLKMIIMKEEKRLGYFQGQLDRKSVKKAVGILSRTKKVKVIRIVVTEPAFDKSRIISFVCKPDVNEDHPIIKETIKQAKDSLSIMYVKHTTPKIRKITVNMEPLIHLDSQNTCYTYAPKFMRMKILHEMLSYLVFSYCGDENLDQTECRSYMKTVCNDLDDNEKIPQCYVKEISWKMFIPPITKYEEYSDGWVSQSEIAERIPLRLLYMIVRLPQQIPYLEKYMKHPIQQHYLVRDLPVVMQRAIRIDKKYLYSLNMTFRSLAMIGLVQFGDYVTNFRNNVQLIYLNKKTRLLDTRSCPPAYSKIDTNIEYPVHQYNFTSLSDVETYWNDAMRFCLNTKLGRRNEKMKAGDGERLPERLREVIKPRERAEVPSRDDGTVPGDGLGAVGFDSHLHSHLVRSWFFNKSPRSASKELSKNLQSINSYSKPSKLMTQIANRKVVSRMKKFRYIISSKGKCKNRSQKLTYDKNDIEALKNLKKMRVQWSDREDSILLICQVAVSYCAEYLPNHRPARLIRKLLHDTCSLAIDKTALACSRRMYRLMKNKIREHTVNVYSKELSQDETLKKECEPFIRELEKHVKNKDSLNVESVVDKMIEKVFRYLFAKSAEAIELANKGKYEISLPTSLESFKELYNYEYPNKDVDKTFILQTDTDVKIHVIINLIFSTLLSQVDKTKTIDMNHFCRVFTHFEDDELKSALSYVRNCRLISFNKSSERFRSSYLPIGQGVYHLSMTLHLTMKSLYSTELYSQMYRRYLELRCSRFDNSLEVTSYDVGLSCILMAYHVLDKINLDVRIPDNILVFHSKPLTFVDPEEIAKPMFEAKSTYTEQTRALVRETFFNVEEKSATTSNETDPGLLETNKYCSDGESEGEVEFEAVEDDYGLSNITVALTRVQFKQNDARFSNAYDHYLINVFSMKCSITDTSLASDFNLPHTEHPYGRSRFEKEVIFRKLRYTKEEISNKIKKHFFETKERDLSLSVLEFLHERGIYGATCELLRETFNDLKLLKMVMDVLCHIKLALRCGSKHTHYVHIDFAVSWLLPCYKNTQLLVDKTSNDKPFIIKRNNRERDSAIIKTNENQLWVNLKPWIHSNGELNTEALHCLLIRILCFVVRNPGSSLLQAQKKFVPALQPFFTRELLEILQNLGCLKVLFFSPKSSVDLFSVPTTCESIITDAVTGFEDENTLIMEPDVNALIKLSTYIGTPNYNDLLESKYVTDLSNSTQFGSIVDNSETDEIITLNEKKK